MSTIDLRQGYTSRYVITGKDANGQPYNYTGKTIELIVKTASDAPTAAMLFTLTVDGSGSASSSPSGRMFLGRPNALDLSGPLTDTAPTSGYLTVRFAPSDSVDLVTVQRGTFVWEARVVLTDDAHYLDSGQLNIEDSIFEPGVTP